MNPDEAGTVFTTPAAYADDASFHQACAVLRREDPVHLVSQDPLFAPFWAITKHADIMEIEAKPNLFTNAPFPVLGNIESQDHARAQGDMLRTLIHMDDPDHRVIREVTAEWFLPRNLEKLQSRLAGLAATTVDGMFDLGGRCDFARDVAMNFPLSVINGILGLPESDFGRMLMLTQELFGSADPEMQRGTTMEDLQKVIMEFFVYFGELTAARRATPTDDLASVIANATIDGRLLNDLELISYYVIIATAGHDTTSSAIAGGLQALIEHPDQLQRLRDEPGLIPKAVDEMIRWTTPVKHFMRTAQEDYVLRGRSIAKGDWLLLSYPSGNRDEDVFTDPFTFDAGRSPNKHLAFGFGVHFCLGAMLARMEMKALFAELIPRLDDIALAGEPALMQTLFVGGHKRLPIQYSMHR
ncbi:MAG: cytochrome [Ilumatobacteraceae bacterium]|nr:cytochrome [Ilumatobacteraceae bacterium]